MPGYDMIAAAREEAVRPYRETIARIEAEVRKRLLDAGEDEAFLPVILEGCCLNEPGYKAAWDAFYAVWYRFHDQVQEAWGADPTDQSDVAKLGRSMAKWAREKVPA